MGTGEPSLSFSQPLSISSSCWLWVKIFDLLYFYAFFALLLLVFWFSCQSTISLLFIIHLEFWAWFSTINTSKEPKGRFGPFSHFWSLSQNVLDNRPVQLRTKHQFHSIIIKNQNLKNKSKKIQKSLVQPRKLGIVMIKLVLVFEEE